MAVTPILPVFPVPVLPQVFDTSLSYYELLAKLTETINQCVTIVNALSERVSEIEQAIGDLPQLSEDVAQLQLDLAAETQARSDAVTQLQLDLAAETQARSDGYDTLYNQINAVRNLVINEYVDNETFDAALGGGIKFNLLTKAAYNALTEYDSHTVYVVYDTDNSFKFWYMGQHATCCEPSTYPEMTSSDIMTSTSASSDSPAELSAGITGIDSGTLLVGIVSSAGALTAGPDSSWTLIDYGTLTSSSGSRNIAVYSKTATETGLQTFSVTVPPGSSAASEVTIAAVPSAVSVSVVDKDNAVAFVDNTTELDTTPDEHRMYIVFSNRAENGVQLPSPTPYGLNHPWVQNYSLNNVIHQYHCTASATVLTGVSAVAQNVNGLFDIWTLKFT